MGDIKTDFKQWLQENYSKSSAYSYYSLVQKIFDKNFGVDQDWQQYSESVIPLLVRYFEFANREYYLDRVTIWYALDYFEKILKFIYSKQVKTFSYNPTVEISLYDGNKDYFVVNIPLYFSNDHIKYIANGIYGQNHNIDAKKIDILNIDISLHNICEQIKSVKIEDIAIHIVYDSANNSNNKAALSKYCDFLYSLTNNLLYLYPSNKLIKLIKNRNPNKTIKGNYKIVQKLTGNNPLQVGIKGTAMPYHHNYNYENNNPPTDFVLVKEDLAEILNFDIKTIKKYFEEGTQIYKMLVDPKQVEKTWKIKQTTTVIRNYFSIKSTNAFLKAGLKQLKIKHKTVDYDCEGYKYWVTRLEATKFLNISHNAFHCLIDEGNCSRLKYIPDKVKYYAPDLEYLKNTHALKRAYRRKIKYVKTNNYNQN